jgi:ferredoxin-NADP reductase
MSFLRDNLIPFFKQREIRFKESFKDAEDVRTFLFEKPDHLTWKAGQYGLYTITHKKIKNGTKPFSVASAPHENVIRITTRIAETPSEFKQALLELKPGMTVTMRGPVGPFYLSEDGPVLMIAAGMGITPFRSILKQLEFDGKTSGQPRTLLYLDRPGRHLFREELDRIASKLSIKVAYLEDKEDLQQEIDKFAASHADAQYFIAGPQAMANSLAGDLQKKQIPKRNIRKDAFFGY